MFIAKQTASMSSHRFWMVSSFVSALALDVFVMFLSAIGFQNSAKHFIRPVSFESESTKVFLSLLFNSVVIFRNTVNHTSGAFSTTYYILYGRRAHTRLRFRFAHTFFLSWECPPDPVRAFHTVVFQLGQRCRQIVGHFFDQHIRCCACRTGADADACVLFLVTREHQSDRCNQHPNNGRHIVARDVCVRASVTCRLSALPGRRRGERLAHDCVWGVVVMDAGGGVDSVASALGVQSLRRCAVGHVWRVYVEVSWLEALRCGV